MLDRIITTSISALRFPLCIGIVLLHTIIVGQTYPYGITIENGEYRLLDVVVYLSQREIGDIAVPLFFFISGFLFFYKTNFTLSTYKHKICKRLRSLLIPYLLWNTLWLVFTFFWYSVAPNLLLSIRDTYDNFTIYTLIDGYVGYSNGPLLAPLWFIRDLMFINLFAYPLFFIIKRFDFIVIPILVSLFVLKIGYEASFIGTRSWGMYAVGAWFAIKKKDIIRILFICRKYLIVCFILLLFIRCILHFNHVTITIIDQIELILGVFNLLLLTAINVRNKAVTLSIKSAKASFFVYVSHMFIINLPNKLWVCLLPVNALTASIVQLVIPILIGFILYYIFILLHQSFPNLMRILVGGR